MKAGTINPNVSKTLKLFTRVGRNDHRFDDTVQHGVVVGAGETAGSGSEEDGEPAHNST